MTNAQLGPVRLDKKAEVILSDGRFAEIFHINVKHLLVAEDSSEMKKIIKIMLQTVYIDGQPSEMEEILDLKYKDFQQIVIQMYK
jgi:hypothetical protein